MKISAITKRLATVGVASALAAGGLVGATATSADAASASTSYTCALITGPTPVTVAVSSDYLVSSIAAGFAVPFELPLQLSVTLPSNVVDALRSFGVTKVDASSSDVTLSIVKVGSTTSSVDIPLNNVVMPATDVPASGTMTLSTPAVGSTDPVNATTSQFTTPAAGNYEVNMPDTFHFTAHDQNGGTLADNAACTLSDGAENAITPLTVTKNASTTKATPATTPYHASLAAKMKVAVTAPNHLPTGKVLVKEGTRTLGSATLNDKGKAVVNMGKLKVGSHTLKVVYKGDGYTKSSSKKVTVKVVK